MIFKVAQKVTKYLGSFYEKFCHQELKKSPNPVTLDLLF